MRWTPLGPPSPPPLPPPLPTPVSFSGDRKEFFRLVARGAGLEFVTVGFYRFWLVTDIRRHLWSNTHIDGDAAEYTGRGRELLIGFLIALAILVPIYLVYFLISIEAERLQGLASVPLIAAFYVFGQFAIYRARRYRLTRTVWRGVRFWMDGSGWAYAARATLWGLLAVLTLGLAFPWRQAALERYKMHHSWYGDLQGRFEGRGWQFFKKIWWLWLLLPVAIVVFPLLPVLYANYKAVEWRWWLSGIRFGAVRLEFDAVARCVDGPLLEGDRMDDPAVDRLRNRHRRPRSVDLRYQPGNVGPLRCAAARAGDKYSDGCRHGDRLFGARTRTWCGVASLSVARSLGARSRLDRRPRHRGGRECCRAG